MKNTIFSLRNLLVGLIAFSIISFAHAASAQTAILSSNFDAHGSADGAPAFSGISWSMNGAYPFGPGLIFLSPGASVQQGGAAENQDRLAVDQNIDNEGPWTLEIPFVATVKGLILDNVTFDYQFISNGGANQIHAHPDSGVVSVRISDANLTSLSEIEIGPLGTDDSASNSGTGVVVDFPDILLQSGEPYVLEFTVSSATTTGNNMSVDNLALNGAFPCP